MIARRLIVAKLAAVANAGEDRDEDILLAERQFLRWPRIDHFLASIGRVAPCSG